MDKRNECQVTIQKKAYFLFVTDLITQTDNNPQKGQETRVLRNYALIC